MRTALVTGAVTGIGRAIAAALLADGWQVVVHGPQAEQAQAVAAELGALGGVGGDLADAGVPSRLVAQAASLGGDLAGLVNNAADTRRTTLGATDEALFDRIMAVNVRAPLLLIKHAVPHMRTAGGGAVLNVGSVNAHCGQRDLLLYSMRRAR